jgi:hypothetical protein
VEVSNPDRETANPVQPYLKVTIQNLTTRHTINKIHMENSLVSAYAGGGLDEVIMICPFECLVNPKAIVFSGGMNSTRTKFLFLPRSM